VNDRVEDPTRQIGVWGNAEVNKAAIRGRIGQAPLGTEELIGESIPYEESL
jgi:hypothetical protein